MEDKAIEFAALEIAHDLGTLDDLPREFANTIANVYYLLAKFLAEGGQPGYFPREYMIMYGHNRAVEMFLKDIAEAQATIKSLPVTIAEIRKFFKSGRRDLAEYAIELELDVMKYRIENALSKTGLRRAIERKMKKSKPEIPELWLKSRSKKSGFIGNDLVASIGAA